MTVRIRKSVPYSGIYPHREHRSKKGRQYKPDIAFSIKRKRRLEEIHKNEVSKEI